MDPSEVEASAVGLAEQLALSGVVDCDGRSYVGARVICALVVAGCKSDEKRSEVGPEYPPTAYDFVKDQLKHWKFSYYYQQ